MTGAVLAGSAAQIGSGGWTPESVATLVAAGIAAVAALLAAVLSALSAHRTRRQTEQLERQADARYREYTGREQWWTRFSWALEKAVSTNQEDAKLGLAVIVAMLDAPLGDGGRQRDGAHDRRYDRATR
jgi:hypothetical protein